MPGRKPAAKPHKQGQKAQEGGTVAEPSTAGDDLAQLGQQELSSSIKRFQESLKGTLDIRPAADNVKDLARAANSEYLRKDSKAAGQSSHQQEAAGKPDDKAFDVLAALNQLTHLRD